MEEKQNLNHWENWADLYGAQLLATTKCQTIKSLELDGLIRAIQRANSPQSPNILEIGCGNGANLVGIRQAFPSANLFGMDFSPSMISNAESLFSANNLTNLNKPSLSVMDARTFSVPCCFEDKTVDRFDIIFTDRMLINLASADEQLGVMREIMKGLSDGGKFLMLENSAQNHVRLNRVRSAFGLPERSIPEFNVFIDESTVIDTFKKDARLESREDISSLHDLILYAVDPSTRSDQEVQYDSSLMKNLTTAIRFLSTEGMVFPEGIGRNILWTWVR